MMTLGPTKTYEIMGIKAPKVHEDLWWEAEEWAELRASEEGDVDIDRDYDILEAWQEKHYLWLCEQKGVEPYVYEDSESSSENSGSKAE